MIGDIAHDDTSYGDGDSSSLLSVDYYRNQVRRFQETMNALDATIYALGEMRDLLDDGDSESIAEWNALWNEAISKRGTFKATAQAINLAADGLNAVGVRFPVLSIPQTLQGLGIAPAVLLAIAGAVAGAAALIAWGNDYIQSVRAWAETKELLQLIPENKRAAWAEKTLSLREQERIAAGSPFAAIAGIVKWAAIGGAVYAAYRMFAK